MSLEELRSSSTPAREFLEPTVRNGSICACAGALSPIASPESRMNPAVPTAKRCAARFDQRRALQDLPMRIEIQYLDLPAA